jgi:hypothetical protein
MLDIRVTKYYHTPKIRDEKRGAEHTKFTWNIRGNPWGKSGELSLAEEITRPRSKYKERQITLSLEIGEY